MRQLSPIVLLAAAVGAIVLLLALAFFTAGGDSDQDKLTGNESESAAAADPASRCASERTYDTIKRELFRRAARMRGTDQSAFDRLSAYAVLRMENPVVTGEDEERRAVNCSGSLSLDLPPGVAVVGGRRNLAADVSYTVQRAADGSGDVVLLRNADAIIAPLATLGRVGQAQSQPLGPVADGQQQQAGTSDSAGQAAPPPEQDSRAAPPPRQQSAPREVPQAPQASTSARPSFNCANARTRGEIAVCRDSGLASLDRQMAAQFYRSRSQATAAQRAALERTRTRFLRSRDSCRSDACIAESYRDRIREISEIMSDE